MTNDIMKNEQASSPAAITSQSNGLSDKELEWLGKWLSSIDSSLKSIKSTLTFFAVLVIIGLIVQGCNVLLTFGR